MKRVQPQLRGVADHTDPSGFKPMKRKAVITVEYEAEDYFKIRSREGQIRRALSALETDFERIEIRFADRRPRSAKRAAAPDRAWPRT